MMRIKELRLKRGFSQTQLAIKLGVCQQAVARWEAGIASPTADKLPKIAHALRCDINALYEEKP
jgi:transcriptional regulator with XRE-family HTH domain